PPSIATASCASTTAHDAPCKQVRKNKWFFCIVRFCMHAPGSPMDSPEAYPDCDERTRRARDFFFRRRVLFASHKPICAELREPWKAMRAPPGNDDARRMAGVVRCRRSATD